MLGTCPNCKIKLKEPPFGNRNTNEVMLVLSFRDLVENRIPIKSMDELGYCQLCNATKKDLEEQISQKVSKSK